MRFDSSLTDSGKRAARVNIDEQHIVVLCKRDGQGIVDPDRFGLLLMNDHEWPDVRTAPGVSQTDRGPLLQLVAGGHRLLKVR